MEVALGTSGPRPTTLRTCPSRDARSRLVPPEEHARMRTSTRLVSAGAVAGLALLATASPATDHVSPAQTEGPVGASTSVAPHTGLGCEASNTTSLALQIPESHHPSNTIRVQKGKE